MKKRIKPRLKFTVWELKKAREFATILGGELHRAEDDEPDPYDYDFDTEAYYQAFVRKVARKMKLKGISASGCYRAVFIGKTFVLKFSMNQRNSYRLRDEVRFINKWRKDKKYGRHFPLTQIVRGSHGLIMQIQEKIDMDQSDRSRYWHHVEDLAVKLGIEDCHEENYGWAGPKNKPYPVFVDMEYFGEPDMETSTPIRSWMV